ncbi:MAG: RNase adapter RapZ [Acidobacteria bacterium]|nr:MAG: RNase adapter RapZ [Acidobacteriota bacterium]REK01392.1 MAG: RNase adapter RapZ [Acidobacteriota bacterium]REK14348.1 MAG: RNase adapter RapZ [Acidobacteriota bacterium]REK45063.1 MAG: RNase adapter RapZ [Acidobacteriota bacterium]
MSGSENGSEIQERFIIITGLSGSGMSSATNAFEDLGYFCVDNLPVTMLATFARLLLPNTEGVVAIEKAALVIDIRERHFLSEFSNEMKKLRKKGLDPYILFFDATDKILKRRFSETRRPHPNDDGAGVIAAIRSERDAMNDVRERADLIVDTSRHTVHTLRRFLLKKFGDMEDGVPLQVQIISFGHKHGVPRDVDLLFDVRHLPNPYFEKRLRPLAGTDPKVIKFLVAQDEVRETIRRFDELLEYLLPLYRKEGKSYLTIGIGCTGGRHRSVMAAEQMGEFLRGLGYETSVQHRDVMK